MKETIYINNSNNELTVQQPTITTIQTSINIDNTILPINITADFKDVPPRLHEIFLRRMLYQYHNQYVVRTNNTNKVENKKQNWLQKLWNKI